MVHVISHTTLVLAHITIYLAVLLIVFRLGLRWHRRERLGMDDYVMLSSIIWLAIRLAMIHMVLIWGTNNVSEDTRNAIIDTTEIWRREQASKMLLVNRFAYNTLWANSPVGTLNYSTYKLEFIAVGLSTDFYHCLAYGLWNVVCFYFTND